MTTVSSREITTARAISEAIAQEMKRDERVFIMGEDIGKYGGIFGATQGLYDQFGPDRVMDTPISETAFIGAAIGAAAEGMRPIVELMFVDFFGVCMDQIYNQLAKNTYMSGGHVRLPVTLLTAYGAGYDDAAQHSQALYSIFAHVPGLKVIVPSTPYDAKGLLIEAIRDDNPAIYFMHKGIMGLGWMTMLQASAGPVPEAEYTIPLGVADIKRSGTNLTIVTIGMMVHRALEAAEKLADQGISAEVLDLRTLVPLDREAIINSVKRTHHLLVVDEDYRSFGMTGEVIATVAESALDYLDAPARRIAEPDTPIPYSRPLEQYVLPSVEKIIRAAHELLGR